MVLPLTAAKPSPLFHKSPPKTPPKSPPTSSPPSPSLKPKKPHAYSKPNWYLVLPLFVLLTIIVLLPAGSRSLSECPHVLLFTQMRHGSTWFIDNVEHCRYSTDGQVEAGKFNKQVFPDTELWHIYDSPLRNLPVPDVIKYLSTNSSLKIFPTTMTKSETNVRRLIRQVRDNDENRIPIVVLRRRLNDAWNSFEDAVSNGSWAKMLPKVVRVLSGEKPLKIVGKEWRPEKRGFEMVSKNFFKRIEKVFKEERVDVDWVWYEDIKNSERIVLESAGCYLRNCNYL